MTSSRSNHHHLNPQPYVLNPKPHALRPKRESPYVDTQSSAGEAASKQLNQNNKYQTEFQNSKLKFQN